MDAHITEHAKARHLKEHKDEASKTCKEKEQRKYQ